MSGREDTSPKSAVIPELFEPRSLEWQENGELAANEVFELVKRLRAVEPVDHVNELWRLSHKS